MKKQLREFDKRIKYFPFGDDLPSRSVVYRECNLHVIRCDGLTASFAWNTLPLAEVLLRSGSKSPSGFSHIIRIQVRRVGTPVQFSCHVTVLMTPGYDVVMHSFSASLRTGLRPFPKQRARSQANFRMMKDKRLSWNVPVYNFFSLMFTKREMNFSASTTFMLVISSMKLIISVQVSI